MEQDVVEDLGLPSSATIYSLSLDCQKCFGRICDELQSLEQDEANQNGYNRNFILLSSQDSRAKFKAWGTSIAALRKPSLPTSLEHRLRDAPEIRSRLLQVLTYLHEYLNDGLPHFFSSSILNLTDTSGKSFRLFWERNQIRLGRMA